MDLVLRLNGVPGLESINAIHQWIENGKLPHAAETSPNVLLSPLTIIFQIVAYFEFLNSKENRTTHASVLKSTDSGGIQGFCSGFLVIAALASSENEEEINLTGAVTLRLALCVGAFVDFAGSFANPPNEIACLTVR